MSDAREAVARALGKAIPLGSDSTQVDYVLTALRPIIAAEIQAWAEAADYNADTIASRICGGEA